MGLAWSVSANAADLQWSANGVTPGGGGTGTWNTTTPLWFNGATFQTWNNAALDNAVFGGTAGTVTLGVAITAHNLTFNTSGYTVTGNTLTLGGVSPTIGVVSGGNATVGSVMAGTAGLTQAGPGTLILTGANTYTGGTTISAGTLQIGNGGTTGSVAGNIVDNTALVFNRSNNLTYAGVISGTGSLTKSGAGTLTLTGNSTYTGGTTISAGTLAVSSDANLGAASGGLTFGGGTLQSTATFSSNRGVTLTGGGTLNTNAATTLTLGGAITGTGSLTKSGTGTLTLSGNNTYTGTTTISAGTLALSGSIASSSQVNVSNAAGTFDISGTSSGATITTLNGVANSHVSLGGQTLTISNGLTTYAGIIQGTGGLTVTGGTQTLSGANTYTGGTTISAGTLQIGNGGATGSVTGDIVDNAALVFNRTGTLTYGGVISGTGSLAKIGTGTLTLTGNNTYAGGTTINAGTLAVSSDANLGAASGGLTFGGGTLQSTATFSSNRGVTLSRRRHVQYQRCDNIDVGRRHHRSRLAHQERDGHADAVGEQYLHGHYDHQRRNAGRRQRRQPRRGYRHTQLKRGRHATVSCGLHLGPQRDDWSRQCHLRHQRPRRDVGRRDHRRLVEHRAPQDRGGHADADGEQHLYRATPDQCRDADPHRRQPAKHHVHANQQRRNAADRQWRRDRVAHGERH